MAYLDIQDEREKLSKNFTSNGIECISITKKDTERNVIYKKKQEVNMIS